MVEPLSKLEIEENFPNLIKGIYKKPTANFILIHEIPIAFPSKIGNKTKMSTLITSTQHCTRGANQCNKARKSIQIGKK